MSLLDQQSSALRGTADAPWSSFRTSFPSTRTSSIPSDPSSREPTTFMNDLGTHDGSSHAYGSSASDTAGEDAAEPPSRSPVECEAHVEPERQLPTPNDSTTHNNTSQHDNLSTHPQQIPNSEEHPRPDLRALIRLMQCAYCSLPFRNALTLPCGNSICRKCLPDLYKRELISYPVLPGRSEGLICPFPDCRREHVLGDCSQDVTLAKVLEKVDIEMTRMRSSTSDSPLLLTETLPSYYEVSSRGPNPSLVEKHSRILNGGRLLATYTLVELGELRYDSDLVYSLPSGEDAAAEMYQELDIAMTEQLREVVRAEMDCQVCYALMLDPLTTPCGHTFCRKCVARVLDHSDLCPVCRRTLRLPPGAMSVPSNKRLSKLLWTLVPDLVAARGTAVEREEATAANTDGMGGGRIPLFVCTLAYPSMPTFLHVFEPRYRLMIRRAMESGSRTFGMLPYNQRGEPQGDLGVTQFLQYGTLLRIESLQMLPDGRSIIETHGVSRFRVLDHGMLDGYVVGRVERVDDISMVEEEALEGQEVATYRPVSTATGEQPSSDSAAMPGSNAPNRNPSQAPLASLSTLELLEIGTAFITRMRAAAAPWLAANYIAAHGPMPDDPALFPYWFATVLPIHEAAKYRLLSTRSVRERLKITAGWVRQVEGMRW